MQQSRLWLRGSFTQPSCTAVIDKKLLLNDKKGVCDTYKIWIRKYLTPKTQEISYKETCNIETNNNLPKVLRIDKVIDWKNLFLCLCCRSWESLYLSKLYLSESKSALKIKEQNWKEAFHCLYSWVWVNIRFRRLLCLWCNMHCFF